MTFLNSLPDKVKQVGSDKLRAIISWGLLISITAYYFLGISQVPFHPDESSWIFMSSDLQDLLTQPLSLEWKAGSEGDLKQSYRELNSPLAKYLIGAGRMVMGYAPLTQDWDWSKSWEENNSAGALPSPGLLLVSRFSIALLFPFCLWLVYNTGKTLDHWLTGLIAAGFYGLNALVLIHTRRAMAESALVFGVCLTIWAILKTRDKPWIAAIAMALAINAKQTNLALFPVILVAIAWAAWEKRSRLRDILFPMGLFCLIVVITSFLLNPLFWSNPLQAGLAGMRARQTLLNNQVSATSTASPLQVLSTPSTRIIALIANVFILPPSVEDVGNYIQQTSASKTAYFNIPGVDLFRGLAGGGAILFLALTGVVISFMQLLHLKNRANNNLILFFAGFILEAGLLLVTIPLPYQRYWMPLIPFLCFCTALPLSQAGLALLKVIKKTSVK